MMAILRNFFKANNSNDSNTSKNSEDDSKESIVESKLKNEGQTMISSRRVYHYSTEGYKMRITSILHDAAALAYAAKELLIVAGNEYEDLKLSDVEKITCGDESYYIIRGSGHTTGTGYNPIDYWKVVPVEEVIGKMSRTMILTLSELGGNREVKDSVYTNLDSGSWVSTDIPENIKNLVYERMSWAFAGDFPREDLEVTLEEA